MAADSEMVLHDPVIGTLILKLSARLGDHLKELWLFGSRARGDARSDSDYDILVVAEGPEAVTSEIVFDEGYDLMYSRSALVGAITYSPEIWDHAKNSPLGINIQREGIRLV